MTTRLGAKATQGAATFLSPYLAREAPNLSAWPDEAISASRAVCGDRNVAAPWLVSLAIAAS